MLKEQSFDIIDICTNGKYHFDIAMKVLSKDMPPRIIFIEKAPTSSLEQLDKLMTIAKQKMSVWFVPIHVTFTL